MHPALHPHQRLHEIFRKHGLARPSTALEARAVALRLRTIASSDLLDWTSRQFVEQSALAGALKILNVKEMARLRPIGVVCRQENCLPHAVGRFIDIIRRMTKQMVALR